MISAQNLIHHVFFYLKNPDNAADAAELKKGLEKLSGAPTIKAFHIGKPAGTRREVIDSSYALSWWLLFETKEDQDSYQVDPMHLKFIEECSHLWSKVIVYDTVNAD